jgi:Ca2+-transporting ATPase
MKEKEIKGLSSAEANKRLKFYGKNEIKKEKKVSGIKIFLSQFSSPLILLLISAAVISLILNYQTKEFLDTILIFAIVFASGIAGFIQDYKAEKTVESLKKMATPKARVIRDGKEHEILSTHIVPGDIIVLESGDIIPADAEIIEGMLQIDESILTGESTAVTKKKNEKIFSFCSVYTGKAIAKVIATGMNTEIGKIAEKVQEIKESKTPFEIQIEEFTKRVIYITILIIILTFLAGFQKFGFFNSFLLAISLAVAAIPEGLPAATTIALSLGAREMAKKNALVRRLSIIESLGSCNVICVDKTGTITEGKMKVIDIFSFGKNDFATYCCYFCNNVKKIIKNGKEEFVGDETDLALFEFSKNKVKIKGERIEEIPFSSERKMMSVVYKFSNIKKFRKNLSKDTIVFSKGATEAILEKCSKVLIKNKIVKLDNKLRKIIEEKNYEYASQSYRVIALAFKYYKKPVEKDLVFLGLAILLDPPRKGVKKAIKECYSAGIRVIMLTGDNQETAKAIAKQIELKTNGAITGKELDNMSEKQLKDALRSGINIFARISPFHKFKITKALKNENVIAMTGDGVNDTLALKEADIGIAMGIRGSEVAKEASDIILLDDNFATIRNAIKEGRRIFENIRKFVNYLLSCNIAEVCVIFLGSLFFPFILLYPVQILWINLVTDGLPAIALSLDPANPNIMKTKPKQNEILDKRLMKMVVTLGIEISIILFLLFLFSFERFGLEKARSILFTGFVVFEFVRIGAIKYSEGNTKNLLKNKLLLLAMLASLLLQLIIIYSPLSNYFGVVSLGFIELLILIFSAIICFLISILITRLIYKKD